MAQLVARLVRNEKVRGSNPLSSTSKTPGQRHVAGGFLHLVRGLGSDLTTARASPRLHHRECGSERR